MADRAHPRKGRGATASPDARYLDTTREAFDDGWGSDDEAPPPLKTRVKDERARSIISRNQSPDIPFNASINPYRGCEHGCTYCYARPTHAYLDLSPGIDFESRLFAKTNAATLLREELAKPGYRAELIALGANTDPYQPIERTRGITRQIVGMARPESSALLKELHLHATRPERVYAHDWELGDLVMFDALGTLHRRDSWDPTQRRLMRQLSTACAVS